jgi:hypothetical protein
VAVRARDLAVERVAVGVVVGDKLAKLVAVGEGNGVRVTDLDQPSEVRPIAPELKKASSSPARPFMDEVSARIAGLEMSMSACAFATGTTKSRTPRSAATSTSPVPRPMELCGLPSGFCALSGPQMSSMILSAAFSAAAAGNTR